MSLRLATDTGKPGKSPKNTQVWKNHKILYFGQNHGKILNENLVASLSHLLGDKCNTDPEL